MHDTPPDDTSHDDALAGELRELMERAAAGLAPLPDLTQEAVRLGRRRRFRARAAVVGAVTGVLAAGGIGSAVLAGAGGTASQPVTPAVAPPPTTNTATVPFPALSPAPLATATAAGVSEAALRARTANALTQALGDLIGPVSPHGTDLFAGRTEGHVFPVTFQVVPGKDTLVECPEPPGTALVCRTAHLSGDRIEARVVVSGGALWGGQSVSVSYRYVNSTVKLTVGPDTDARVSPPVTADQLVAAAGASALLAEVKREVKEAVAAELADPAADFAGGASVAPPDPSPNSLNSPNSSASPNSSVSDTGSTNETGGTPDE
ncbi:hypothetical protein [Streptomyces geranii]|uniref:hypothetical protein n=1 Tax=Streptomyces geranii TaxID=2058923 RepID=UPI000D02C987|nr:hypothetical protein [Streptomyces geranii]